MTNLINHLKQLDKDATPRPWLAETHEGCIKSLGPAHPDHVHWGGWHIRLGETEAEEKSNAELILSLRNALPFLISLLEAGEKLRILAGLLTVRQVIEAGDKYIDAAGLHPWAINEGLATGEERLSFDNYDYHFDTIKKELE